MAAPKHAFIFKAPKAANVAKILIRKLKAPVDARIERR
jgi:hypothetical protein